MNNWAVISAIGWERPYFGHSDYLKFALLLKRIEFTLTEKLVIYREMLKSIYTNEHYFECGTLGYFKSFCGAFKEVLDLGVDEKVEKLMLKALPELRPPQEKYNNYFWYQPYMKKSNDLRKHQLVSIINSLSKTALDNEREI